MGRALSLALQSDRVADTVRGAVVTLAAAVASRVVDHDPARVVTIEAAFGARGAVTVAVNGGMSGPTQGPVHAQWAGASDQASSMLDAMAVAWGTWRSGGVTTVWFTVEGIPDQVGAVSPAEGPVPNARGGSDAATVRAASDVERAAVEAAATAAEAAQGARLARATAVDVAAAGVAEAATRTMKAVQAHAEELASVVAAAAATQAALVAQSAPPGSDAEAERQARDVEQQVTATALAKADETARAALLVAREVAVAAAAVAQTAQAAAASVERDVAHAAQAIGAVTAATARQAAAEAMERGEAVALATRDAAEATLRLNEAHRQLQRSGLHDRMVALALQEAMLTRLPESDGLQLAARYLTAAGQDQVGGDWYDALALPDGNATLVIGDVIGHDINAAASMGQLRNVLRTLAWDRGEGPGPVLSRLDRANRDLRIDTMATLIVVNIEPPPPGDATTVATLRWSNAGHPAPVLVHDDGTVIALETASDLLLGVRPNSIRHDHSHHVPPGATLFLYTDGLVETRTDGIDVGQQRLLDSLGRHHHLEPAQLLDAVLSDMVGDQPEDDVAVLAARFAPS